MNLKLPLITITRSALLLCLTAAVITSCQPGADNPSSAAVPGNTIIIDHTAVELFDSIPAEYLAAAKSRLVWIVGESHSAQIPTGLERLEAADNTYSVQVGTDDLANLDETTALRVYRGITVNMAGRNMVLVMRVTGQPKTGGVLSRPLQHRRLQPVCRFI